MKRFILSFLLASVFLVNGYSNDFFSQAELFLSSNVINGRVAYRKITAEPQQLNTLVNQIAIFDLTKATKATLVAFMINAYNILAIKGIVDEYPVKSPMNISGFFDKSIYNIGGKKMSLNQLEKEQLYPLANDPRLHFVLVCAAISCPKLANFAYQPELLEDQLNSTTRNNLNDPEFVMVAGTKFKLSEIFSWYAADFRTNEKNVIQFINDFRDVKLNIKGSIRYYSYNWDLNDQD